MPQEDVYELLEKKPNQSSEELSKKLGETQNSIRRVLRTMYKHKEVKFKSINKNKKKGGFIKVRVWRVV